MIDGNANRAKSLYKEIRNEENDKTKELYTIKIENKTKELYTIKIGYYCGSGSIENMEKKTFGRVRCQYVSAEGSRALGACAIPRHVIDRRWWDGVGNDETELSSMGGRTIATVRAAGPLRTTSDRAVYRAIPCPPLRDHET